MKLARVKSRCGICRGGYRRSWRSLPTELPDEQDDRENSERDERDADDELADGKERDRSDPADHTRHERFHERIRITLLREVTDREEKRASTEENRDHALLLELRARGRRRRRGIRVGRGLRTRVDVLDPPVLRDRAGLLDPHLHVRHDAVSGLADLRPRVFRKHLPGDNACDERESQLCSGLHRLPTSVRPPEPFRWKGTIVLNLADSQELSSWIRLIQCHPEPQCRALP